MTRALPIVISLALMIYAFVDCLQTDRGDIRGPSKPVWIALIVLLPIVGPVAWLVSRRLRQGGEPPRPHAPPVAPDDNPDFLRELRQLDSEQQQMLSQWEADLRRREDELRDQHRDDE